MTPTWPALAVLTPLVAAGALAALPRRAWGIWGNLAASGLGFALACRLPWVAAEPVGWLIADPVAVHVVVLNSFVGLAAAWFSRCTAPTGRLRLYHALFQIMLGSTNLALLADNTLLTYAAMEAAVLALIAATWQPRLLAGAALVLAAFGTLLLYLAALPALGPGWDALRWSALGPAAAHCDGATLSLAFTLLLLGYGALVLPGRDQPWGGVLSGALPGVALVLILRLRVLLAGNAQAISPGGPIMALGLTALLVCGVVLWRERDARRWLTLGSVGQYGLVAVAFGLGGSAALAGLVLLTAHSLAKAAAVQAVGRPGRWALRMAVLALAGAPPFGLFTGGVLLMEQAVQRALWLALPLGAGLLASCWALAARLPRLGAAGEGGAALAGAWACLAAALLFGLAMPTPLAAWLQAIAP